MELFRHSDCRPRTGETEIEQFREQTLRVLLLAPYVFGLYILYRVATGPPVETVRLSALIGMSVAVGCLAMLASRIGATTGAVILVAGLAFLTVSYAASQPDLPLVTCLCVSVLVAGVLLGPLAAFATAGVSSGLLLVLERTYLELVPSGTIVTAIVLLWLVAALHWLATRPIHAVLQWAWASYEEAREQTEKLRDQRGRLARVSKSLEETCALLATMNRDLELAREAAEQARQLKAEFAAAVSHELRTPVNIITAFSEMLIQTLSSDTDPIPDLLRDDVEAIHRNACHISNLIDDILDLSQIDAHRLALHKEDIRMADTIARAVEMVGTMYQQARLDLDVVVPDDLPSVHADPLRIRQVLVNLLINALRFTDIGGVTIRAAPQERDVVVSVSDTGIGIPADDLPFVFHEFQGPRQPRHGRIGSGLGLAVSKRFIELHGGNMWVESTVGQGTTFYFTLPCCATIASVPADLQSETWRITARHAPTERTVLVVGDDELAPRFVQRYLDGFRVEVVDSPQDARLLVERETVHAVIATSEQAVAACYAELSGHPTLPIALCLFSRRADELHRLHGVEYLVKPIDRDQLAHAIGRHVATPSYLLIAEDDPDMARLLVRMASSAFQQARIRTAPDGEATLALIAEERPDLVVLDIFMPGISGWEVVARLRANETTRDLPVIIVSAQAPVDAVRTVQRLTLTRSVNLTIAEAMRCLKASLDALTAAGGTDIVPARREEQLA